MNHLHNWLVRRAVRGDEDGQRELFSRQLRGGGSERLRSLLLRHDGRTGLRWGDGERERKGRGREYGGDSEGLDFTAAEREMSSWLVHGGAYEQVVRVIEKEEATRGRVGSE